MRDILDIVDWTSRRENAQMVSVQTMSLRRVSVRRRANRP